MIHELFVEWPCTETFTYFYEEKGVDSETAILYTFLIWTPILILFSWALEILVDTPSKNFAYLLDIQTRVKRPPPPKKEKKEPVEGEMDNMEEPE